MELRDGVADDALAIAVARVEGWRLRYRGVMSDAVLDGLSPEGQAGEWRERLEHPERGDLFSVAVIDGDVIGFTCSGPLRPVDGAEPPPDPQVAGELYALYVRPAGHGHGTGTALLTRARSQLDTAGLTDHYLWTLAANTKAQAFYERRGWVADGAKKITSYGGEPVSSVRYRWRPRARGT